MIRNQEHIHILGPRRSGKTVIAYALKASFEKDGLVVKHFRDQDHNKVVDRMTDVFIWDDCDPPKNVTRKCIHITDGG